MRHVHVVVSDSGWILERLAREIADRLSYVTYGLHPDPSAALQYYVTYGARNGRISPKEAALFTHLEADPTAASKFFDVASDVECAIAMSEAAARPLREHGVDLVEVISPGVDLDRYYPITRIGVVGRTYHTGRKGEALLNELPALDGIEFVYTGDGWPGPATRLPDAEMPNFYRGLDYVLVPATNEGGPMCVLEALSSGVPVIGSDVGWISDFPHISFERGNAASLRAVLENLRDKKAALRQSVEERTWESWAVAHDRVFTRLLGGVGKWQVGKPKLYKPAERPISAKLLTHGFEAETRGGPSVRVPRTANALRKLGIDAHVGTFPAADAFDAEVVHLFNMWPTDSAVSALRLARAAGKRTVFSPILLDLSELGFWSGLVHSKIAEEGINDRVLDSLLRDYRGESGWSRLHTPVPGFASQLTEIGTSSDRVIFLSEYEREIFQRLVGSDVQSAIVRNPVDSSAFLGADPEPFRQLVGLTDFILCVARLEPRKNQLLLLRAAKELGLPVVLVGHSGADWYERALKQYAGAEVRFVGRLDPNSSMLRSAFAACRVFALPSWAEGAPLAALEGAAAGANLVLSSRSGESEYFGELARYVDPANLPQLKDALHDAWFDADRRGRADALRSMVAAEYTWEAHAQQTAEVYRAACKGAPLEDPSAADEGGSGPHRRSSGEIIMDVTTSLHHGSMKSGITRVEAALSQALIANEDVNVRFVVWAHGQRRFVEVPRSVVEAGGVRAFLELGAGPALLDPLPMGGAFVVVGSGWMQNGDYAEALSEFASRQDLDLNVVIHDLTPVYWSHWYPKGYSAVFVANLKTLLRTADRVLTYSKSTARDTIRFAAESAIRCPQMGHFKLASEIDLLSPEIREPREPRYEKEPFAKSPFVLVVGAIHKRKNYELLYDCWLELRATLGEDCPHLVVVGGVSWNGEETARALREDGRIARFVHILSDVDDESLAWLYEHCALTVYPSLYEGWGLPVAESLAHGQICIASNTSSVPEIAPALTDLLDPTDRRAWTARILHYVTSKSSRSARQKQIRDTFVPVSWTESASTLAAAVAAGVPARSNRFPYNLGTVCDLSQPEKSHKLQGWYSCESFGSWASSTNAALRFDMRPVPDEDLLFVATLRSLGRTGERFPVSVFANDTKVVNWDVEPGSDLVRFGVIPRGALRSDGRLDLRFQTPRTELVRHVHPGSADLRDLGVGLCNVQIVRRSASEDLMLTGRVPTRCAQQTAVVAGHHPAANDDGIVRYNGGARLFLPGFAGLQHPTLVVAADCLEPGAQRNWDAIVMFNGRAVGEMPQKFSGRLHCFHVPESIATLHDPAVIEIVPKSTYPNRGDAHRIQVHGIAAVPLEPRKVLDCTSEKLDLTDPHVQLSVAAALVSGGGAFPAGIRLGIESKLIVALRDPAATVALVRVAESSEAGQLQMRLRDSETNRTSVVERDGLSVVDLRGCAEGELEISNGSCDNAGPVIESLQLSELLSLPSNVLRLGEDAPEYVIADGFYPPEANEWWSGRWSARPEGTLCFRNSDVPVERILVELEVGFVPEDEPVLLRVSVNDEVKLEMDMSQIGPVRCDIEARIPAQSICKLTIEVDRTFIPTECGFPADERVLGIFVRSVCCVPGAASVEGHRGLRLASSSGITRAGRPEDTSGTAAASM